MNDRRTRQHRLVLSFALLVSCSSLCRSAPILPPQPELRDEVRALAGLKKVRVSFEADPDLLKTVRFAEEDRLRRAERELKTAGLALSDDPDAAELRVTLMVEGDPKYDDLVSITYQLSLLQSVIVPRLGERYHVPTYTLVFGDLASRGKVHDVIDENLWPMVNRFVNRISTANRVRKKGK